MKPKGYEARLYLGNGRYKWLGRYPTKRERDRARAIAYDELESGKLRAAAMTCDDYAERFLTEYEASHKDSSADTARAGLVRFRAEFGDRPLDSLSRIEAKDWVAKVPPSSVRIVVTLFNQAMDDELLERNPFRGLGHRGRGRRDQDPPTEAELDKLLKSCSALGWYADQMRALLTFAAYSGMRPGEIFALEWRDVDIEGLRLHVRRRVYKRKLDTPKNNKPKTIALTPPARDALLGQPRDRALVFANKRGGMLSQETLSRYWGLVRARAGLDFDFYLATKHFCVHYMIVELGLGEAEVREQMGWGRDVERLLEVYGHRNKGALDRITAAFERGTVTPLRAVEGKK